MIRSVIRRRAATALQMPETATWGQIWHRIAQNKMAGCPFTHDIEAQLEVDLDGARPFA